MPSATQGCFVRANNVIILGKLPQKLGPVLREINPWRGEEREGGEGRKGGHCYSSRGLGLLYDEKGNRGESEPIALFTASQQILAGMHGLSPASSYKSRASKRAHAAEISIRFSEKLKSAKIASQPAIGKRLLRRANYYHECNNNSHTIKTQDISKQ